VDIIGEEPEKWNPKSRETADHSMPYCVAAALIDGKVDLSTFDEKRIADPKTHALMQKIRIVRDAELSAKYPDGIPNDIEIKTRDGRTVRDRIDYPTGHWKNPMSDDQVISKFAALAAPYLKSKRQEQIVDWVFKMDEKDNMRELLGMCVW
jgi:2-methylcitrate dehydratase